MKGNPNRSLQRIDQGIYQMMRAFSWISGGAVIAIMLLAFLDVICSKLFSFGIPGATEWITYLNVILVLPTLAYIQLDTGHINVELFSKMNPKVKTVIRVFSNILGLGCSGFLGICACKLMLSYMERGTMSATSAMAKGAFLLWPFVGVFALGFIVFAISIVWSLVREFTGLDIVNNPMEMGPYTGDKEVEQ